MHVSVWVGLGITMLECVGGGLCVMWGEVCGCDCVGESVWVWKS